MEKTLSRASIDEALQKVGFSQAELARQLQVSPQAVTNWLKGKDFPRPDKLLRLSVLLRIPFEQLVAKSTVGAPVIAFRKRGNTKPTAAHLAHAAEMGELLKAAVPFLPPRPAIRLRMDSPSLAYPALQQAVTDVRGRLGIGHTVPVQYARLIGQFVEAGAVLVPVLWGEKKRHENALHICLPSEDVTFIFLNLDTRLEDFKFWMAHELAHVYTPRLAGTDEGEDFADAFAGALLFPQPCAEAAYADAHGKSEQAVIAALNRHAERHAISLYSVYMEVEKYREFAKHPVLNVAATSIHAFRNGNNSGLVSRALFGNAPPSAKTYLASCEQIFKCPLFVALRAMIKAREMGASYIHQVLDIPLSDATAIHAELAL